MKQLAKLVTTWFGCGYSPFAPGTIGTLGGCIFIILFHLFIGFTWTQVLLGIGIIKFFFLGVKFTNVLEPEWGKDPSRVVVDEVVGIWIAFMFVPFTYVNLLLAFILFRFFDILKPLGIRKLESIDGGMGVMADDVLAGIYANVVLQVLLISNLEFGLF